ncbi:MAG: hypothetical protein HYR94_10640 [Chloroflexi bacterium]|nr:hypothetical protein [Chloroflexota bacterium]
MRHTEILKQAFQITWRYRPLWLFGFLLALCGGGGGNFNIPSGGEGDFRDLENIPNLPNVDPNIIIVVVVGFVCLILLLIVVGVVVQYVTRTALIGMVRQVKETEVVTVRDGWRFGWSNRAWRIFLLSLLIGIPATILTIGLILLALSPLLLLILDNTASKVLGVILTIFACIFVFILLLIAGVVIAPIQELAWRHIALDQQGVIDSLSGAINLIKRRFKDVAIMWLLMFGIAFGWGIVALLVVLPVSFIAAALIGGIPAGLVYLIARSGWGAAIAGVPLGLLALILISSAANGLYLIYQSAAWTLAYLELQQPVVSSQMSVGSSQTPENKSDSQSLTPDPL